MPHYLSNLNVMYSSADWEYSQPDEIVTELQGLESDIGKGFSGYYVWLCPQWTADQEGAISDLVFEQPTGEIKNFNNLALGHKDDYRYIVPKRDESAKITKVGLFRYTKDLSADEINTRIRQSGYTKYGEDINKGRQGDFLRLTWAY